MYREIATHVYKRATADDGAVLQLPGWAFGLLFLDFLLFLPVMFVIGYTFNHLFAVLAMIEDPEPPAYEPVSLNADTDSIPEDAAPLADESARGAQDTRAISSSFRALHRTVYGISGWRSYFRGLACWLALCFASLFVYAIITVIPFMPGIVAAMITGVTMASLYTAWLHIVISVPSPKRFWERLPPFKKAFQATALPTVLYFLALEIHSLVPKLFVRILGMTTWDPKSDGTDVPQPTSNDIWKALIVFIISISITIFVTIPAHVVLTRVQASLLPEEDETIVPFDRSFQGKVVPAIVGGQGFVTIKDAWQTFSRASWIRLVKLYAKIFVINMAISMAMMLLLVPEVFFIVKNSKPAEQGA